MRSCHDLLLAAHPPGRGAAAGTTACVASQLAFSSTSGIYCLTGSLKAAATGRS